MISWLFLLLPFAAIKKNKPWSTTGRFLSPAPLYSLRQVIQSAVLESYIRLESIDEEGRTATAARDKDGSWLLRDRFEIVKEQFGMLMIDETDAMVNSLLFSSPWPIWMNFTSGGAFELSLFCVPPGKTHEPRRHPAGTILVYKRVLGHMRMRSMIGSREIAKDDLSDLVLVRLAGKSIVFESLDGRPAGVFEIAIHPPRRDEEGMGSTSGFDDDDGAVSRMCRIDLNIADGERMFTQLSNKNNNNVVKKNDQNDNQVSVSTLERSIGGLSTQLHTLVRRIIVSRQLSTTLLRKLSLTHVKGLLLHGPPGCGKTLIARQLATIFNNEIEPKIVNGPEILSKYVGEAEANLRALFVDAEEEWNEKGSASGLHVIIFDELDSIARRRGTAQDASGVRDSCVNQLLSKLDGVNQNENVLVIGLTNRKDLIDPALLRPGRFEVHLEIGLPDEMGRQEILMIFFRPLIQATFVQAYEANTWTLEIARRTEGCSGAELAGVMRQAASFAMERWLSQGRDLMVGSTMTTSVTALKTTTRQQTLQRSLQYVWNDFERALRYR